VSIAGYSVQPKRKSVPRAKLLRAYVGTYRDGVLELGRGAWVKTVGEDERRFDASARLSRNIGDRLIVGWGARWQDVAAVEITAITGKNFRESWAVRVLCGDTPANGNVTVQVGRRAS
jgi:hypothetical protein